jgi:tRNA 2-thiocytidine biosynthesis protein TtcA
VIRPLAYVPEHELIRYAQVKQFPIIPCDLCGSQDNLQRKQVKAMMLEWEKRFPGRTESMFRGLQHVVPSHLADTRLFDFAGLSPGEVPEQGGDLALDREPIPPFPLAARPSQRDADEREPEDEIVTFPLSRSV